MSTGSPFIEEVPWWRRFGSASVELISSLSRAECMKRLEAAIDPWWSPLGTRPVQGRVTEDGAMLRRRSRGRNSSLSQVRLRLVDAGGRARITCNAGIATLIVLLLPFSTLVVTAALVAVFMTQFGSNEEAPFPLTFLIAGLAVIFVADIAAAFVISTVARKQRTSLIDFVKTTLSAKEV